LCKLPKKLPFPLNTQYLEVKDSLCYSSDYSCAPQYGFSRVVLASDWFLILKLLRQHQTRNTRERTACLAEVSQ